MKNKDFVTGVKSGIPIGLGYLSVSFTFGMLAASKGVPTLSALLTSMTNLTSAGQVAGLTIMAAGGSLLELALCQIIINLRYALMSMSLSQRLENGMGRGQRLILSFGITDEIFAVMADKKGLISLRYYLGLLLLPYLGWSSGTLLGAFFSGVFPSNIAGVLGIGLYGMFLAIIIPPAKRSRSVFFAVALAAVFSSALSLVPSVSSGTSVILCAVGASALCAWLFPLQKTKGGVAR